MSPSTTLLFKRIGTALLSVVIFVSSAEISLRFYLGAPKGLFLFSRPGKNGMYVPNTSFVAGFGVVPYTIKTNSLGLRGDDLPQKKTGLRIAMIGDSVTDSFFSDNQDTYPALLGRTLRQSGYSVDVINGGRGAGSIDKEYAILREVIAPLDPDIVVLTFVTNDIADIWGRSRDQMLSFTMKPDLTARLMGYLDTQTALGEVSLDVYLRDRFESYRAYEKHQGEPKKDNYQIEGGGEYEENAKVFEKRWDKWDGIVLKEPFSQGTGECISNYFFIQGKLLDYCRDHHAKLVFVYFPSYSQVYDSKTSMKMRDLLSQRCAELGLPFLDLTEAFKEKGRSEVLHLAPIDFHPNPRGNSLMASTLADFLIRQGMMKVP